MSIPPFAKKSNDLLVSWFVGPVVCHTADCEAEKEEVKVERRGNMNANVKVEYEFFVQKEDEAIDIKNKIIANTLDDEDVVIRFRHTKQY